MTSAASYALASLVARPGRALAGALAVGLVVAATSLLSATASRLERALADTADARNLVVLSAGAAGEGTSVIARPQVSELGHRAGVAASADGRPLALGELVIEMRIGGAGGRLVSAVVRGLEPLGAELHERLHLLDGRWPRRGESEVLLGAALAARLGQVRVGARLDLGRGAWTVVGLFAARGATYEDEAWVDHDDLAADAGRVGATSLVRIRTTSEQAREALATEIAATTEPALDALSEPAFYRRRAEAARTLRGLVALIAVLAGTAASAGLANSFHASVDRRRREIGVLRAIGFGRSWVVGAVQIEALAVALAGFVVGALAALTASAFLDATAGMSSDSATTSASESAAVSVEEVARPGDPGIPALDVGAAALAPGMILALAIGLVAAAGPAWRATRVRPAEVLRAG